MLIMYKIYKKTILPSLNNNKYIQKRSSKIKIYGKYHTVGNCLNQFKTCAFYDISRLFKTTHF